jgi:AcrR family transcriptional regulator
MAQRVKKAPQDRILEAAARLLREQGRDAVTTRGVCAAAEVQAQTIYRHFGDMRGLLDAVVTQAFEDFLSAKTGAEMPADPVERLRLGWDMHVEFGLGNPALYTLMYGDRASGNAPFSGAAQVFQVLRANVAGVAEAGLLAVPVDTAAAMIYATGVGITLNLIANYHGASAVDRGISTRTRDAILDAVITSTPQPSERPASLVQVRIHAVSLAALAPTFQNAFTSGEAHLLGEWLARLSHYDDASTQ